MDKQPTKEQIKEFWKWCGVNRRVSFFGREAKGKKFKYSFKLDLPLSLGNLFNYAIPKLFKSGYDYELFSDDRYHFAKIIKNALGHKVVCSTIGYLDPEIALFWAIWQVKANNTKITRTIKTPHKSGTISKSIIRKAVREAPPKRSKLNWEDKPRNQS